MSKAFAAGRQEDEMCWLMAMNMIQKRADGMAHKLQVVHTIDQLRKNPQRATELYSLYAGESVEQEEIPEGVIDTARIERISIYNRFGDDENLKNSKKSKSDTVGNILEGSCFLFIIPSYFNHSCLGR